MGRRSLPHTSPKTIGPLSRDPSEADKQSGIRTFVSARVVAGRRMAWKSGRGTGSAVTNQDPVDVTPIAKSLARDLVVVFEVEAGSLVPGGQSAHRGRSETGLGHFRRIHEGMNCRKLGR